MIQLIKNKDYYGIGLFLLLVVMIGYQKFVSPAIGIFLLVVLAEGFIFKSLQFKLNKYTVLFIFLFIFYLIGISWADHRDVGWKLLEYKMSFFIFPILFFFHKANSNVWLILQGLIYGCLILATRFIIELYFSSSNPLPPFEISRLILDLHPTYSSVYFTMASVFLIYGYFSKNLNGSIFIITPLVLVFCYLVFQMASFAAILFLALSVAIGVGILIYIWLKWKGLIAYILICPVAIYFTVIKVDSLQYDIEMVKLAYDEVSEGKESFLEKNKFEISGTKERVMMWYLSSEIILENPLGVGTGDIDFYLVEKCEKYQLLALKEANLNPHNQFLQIGIDIGVVGLLFLLYLIVKLFFVAVKSRNYFLFFLMLSLFFNALFESVLQRQSGIVFYSCMICLVLVYNHQFKLQEKDSQKNK